MRLLDTCPNHTLESAEMSISLVRSGQVLGRRFVPIVKLNYAQVL